MGGYPAAIKAVRLGAEVTLIEKDLLGGTCLNRGCIPTKSLLQSGNVLKTIKNAEIFGVKSKGYRVDFKAVMNRKKMVVSQLRKGVEQLLAAKKIKVIKGTAEFIDSSKVLIRETGLEIKSDKIIIATGSRPMHLNIEGCKSPNVLDSDRFLNIKSIPKSAVVIGGGVIGVEFAQILNRLGSDVTVLELMDTILPGVDKEIALILRKILVAEGIKIFTGAGIQKIKRGKSETTLTFTHEKKNKKCSAEKVITAVGRKPDLADLKIEKAGLASEKGTLPVNEMMETKVPNIYAVGDVTGGIMLAHVAAAEGDCAAQNAMGLKKTVDLKTVPSCIYTSPEVATVGINEEEAKGKYDVQVGRFPFKGCGKAVVMNETEGMVKIISEKKYNEVLGVHIIGPHATDLIAEAVLGMSMEMTVEELANAVHPHPTLSESVMEAALSLTGGAIHMP